MARKSLPDVSAKFIADVEGMIRDLKRADAATRAAASNIDREVEKLSKNIKRKFSAGDIGKSVLQGLGLGSGFAVAQTAAEAVANYYQKAAESAKTIADLSDQTFEIFKKRMAIGKSDEQLRTELLAEQARIYREIAALEAPKFMEVDGRMDREGNVTTRKVKIDQTQEEAESLARLRKELEQTALALAQYDEKGKQGAAKAADDDRSRRIKALSEGLKQQEDAFDALVSAQKKANDTSEQTNRKADELAEKYRDIGDPLRQYRQQIEEVNRLHGDGRLKAEEAARAIAEISRAMEDAQARRVDDALKDFFGDMDAESKSRIEGFNKVATAAATLKDELNQMWNSVSDRAGQAFADMVLTGEAAFSDLVNIVARAVIEMVTRLAIINPILNALFGGMAGFGLLPAFFGAGAGAAAAGAGAGAGAASASYAGLFAEGGTLEPGQWGIAGENGPEPIFAGAAPLTVIPNGQSKGGNTYYIDARGTDESVIDRLQSALIAFAGPGVTERRALAATSEARRRGTF